MFLGCGFWLILTCFGVLGLIGNLSCVIEGFGWVWVYDALLGVLGDLSAFGVLGLCALTYCLWFWI